VETTIQFDNTETEIREGTDSRDCDSITFHVTPPDEDKLNHSELQSQFAIQGPTRYRADELRDRLKLIESEDAEDSYWSTKLKLPLPTVKSDLSSFPTSGNDTEERLRRHGDYGIPKPLKATVERNTTAAKIETCHHQIWANDDSFTTRGRPRGSKNKRTAQSTNDSTKTSSSNSSSSHPSQRKRPRVERDEDEDQREQDDKKQPSQREVTKDTPSTTNLACPFAKRLPLEYPQCRAAQFRDNAKVK
jgi:hypothetical protein